MFNVEASVERTATRADDMRAVFSYDVILDAIRLVTGRGHVNFIETIAEDVAEIVSGIRASAGYASGSRSSTSSKAASGSRSFARQG